MLREPAPIQDRLEMVTLNELVPEDHLLRQIDQYINFDFIHDEVKDLYCADNGRPAIPPIRLFKMLFIGYLFGIRSERQLVKDIQVNVAYRWFLGLGLNERVPAANTLSQNRQRRFIDSDIEQVIFDKIVEQAIEHGLIGGKVLYTDSTHLKANANKNRHHQVEVEQRPSHYLEALETDITLDREAHGKKPLAAIDKPPKTKTTKISKTDPDAGYMVRDHKPQGFFYLDHRTTDGKHNLITDTHVTAGNVHDSSPYLGRLDRQCQRFDLTPAAVGLDAGYNVSSICHGLVKRDIFGVVGYRKPQTKRGFFYKKAYVYDPDKDAYQCPAGQWLAYSTTSRTGYREYKSDPKVCINCAERHQCTRSKNHTKVVVRHVWEDDKERINQNRLSDRGKAIYRRRCETVERSFADAKQLHGHRYARFRGLRKVKGQCLLAAACQNMKKIAALRAKIARFMVDLVLQIRSTTTYPLDYATN